VNVTCEHCTGLPVAHGW